jgi:DNA-binding transcriptional MerR regulator
MSSENLLIHELAEQASTTVRTIRYYTDEGLLPQPVIQGKYAYYSLNHLNRLELIRRMKDAYLPLREIRQIMNSLSDAEVLLRLQEQVLATPKSELESKPEQSGTKALEYISRLMGEQSAHRPQGTAPPSQSAQPRRRGGQIPIIANQPAAPISFSEGETWQRVPLAPGIELSLRVPTDPDSTIRVQQLIAFAQKLFP